MIRLPLAIGLLAFASIGLKAQTLNMHASVPFDFQINKVQMPAGDYDVEYSGRMVILREKRTQKAAIVLTMSTSRAKAPDTGLLVFNRYGDEYFFSQVWSPYSADGGAAPKTSKERELAKRMGVTPATTVASRE